MKLIQLYLIIAAALLSACNPNIVYEENQAIESGVWSIDNKLEFKLPIEDDSRAYNLFLNLRNGNEYPYSNLYIFMKTVYPNGRSELDTLQFLLADKEGKWYGEGLGEIKSSSVMFRYKINFPMTGEYKFILQQGMRKEALEGIWDVGLRLEKNED